MNHSSDAYWGKYSAAQKLLHASGDDASQDRQNNQGSQDRNCASVTKAIDLQSHPAMTQRRRPISVPGRRTLNGSLIYEARRAARPRIATSSIRILGLLSAATSWQTRRRFRASLDPGAELLPARASVIFSEPSTAPHVTSPGRGSNGLSRQALHNRPRAAGPISPGSGRFDWTTRPSGPARPNHGLPRSTAPSG